MRVLLAGASGTLGRALVPQLLAAGHEVVGITRSKPSADRLRARGAEAIVADVLDRDALLAAVRGQRADAVMNQLTALSTPPLRYESMRMTNRLREEGTANLLEAASLVGARRALTQSIVFGYGYRRHHSGPVDETAPFGVPEQLPVDPIHAALASTERQVFSTPGIEGIALRYGLFYGLDGREMQRMLRRRMLPVSTWEGVVPLVHHEDAASATVAALERGVPGHAYNVAAAPASWRHHLETAARALGAPAPLVLPPWLLRIALPYPAELMTRMDLRVSTERAARELGWTPRYPTVEEGWAAAAGR
ncbi:NAD(P)-dependent oxidoreductase [Naasia sp. SYSU D00948]|uniref:NAD-dependent epimerase/dehydratase family protein n=1 Tax=Naasia sp. SYSU D00948 TaxID=2817379 RepID=UPI001B3007D2|nr:NAD(P)-dependent oxidoreductase [Naasia sp. SYSU D00948]